ncbi:coiled-coil domain-containing protein 116 [Sorex fumeus]|uniref:coiled-coil domain-containing protein 116 n=1 Tax=Sorex fumeus TaxID=62283 RepID=UPI0024ACE684|nr:coiled-coil domain-containing protein 116 [Sorex fumeus]
MTSCRRRSGYLGDDEASHTMYMARVRPSKKALSQETGQAYNLDYVPHPPSTCDPMGSPRFHSHNSSRKDPQSFGSFLDFLVEGQVLDSLQTVVEKATDRMASLKTEAGVPLVEVQDPEEEPHSRRHSRARPRKSMAHQHRGQPSLCTGRPNNYPSCSSSASGSHNSSKADRMGTYYWESSRSAYNLGPLPPIKDSLLLERNLKRLQRLENKGKRRGLSSSWGEFLLWNSLCSQTSSQWSSERPLSWFTGLNRSRQGTLDATGLGSGGRNPILREIDKEIRSLLNQPMPLDLHGYCSLREPHHTLDFLVEHQLFPALQDVVNQAVDKLCRARCHNGYPLFPTNEWEEPNNARPPPPHKKKTIRRTSHKFPKKMPLPSISPAKSSVTSSSWKDEVIRYLTKKTLSLLMCKYKYERQLRQQLGFISFPVTELLMDLFLGIKKVKGSSIRLSSQTDWKCMLEKLQEAEWPQQQRQKTSPLLQEVEVPSVPLDIDPEPEDTSQPSFLPEKEPPSMPDDRYTKTEEQEETNLSEHISSASSDSSTNATQQSVSLVSPEDDHVHDNVDEVETYGFMSKGQPQGASSAHSSLDDEEGQPQGASSAHSSLDDEEGQPQGASSARSSLDDEEAL